MKNVTKILTAAVLCAAIFASDQRIEALGGNAAMWPGDEANIGAFPAQMNNHSFLQITGVGQTTDAVEDDAATVGTDETVDAAWDEDAGVSILMNRDGTTWGFNYGANNDWVNMSWGNGDMGVVVGMEKADQQPCWDDPDTTEDESLDDCDYSDMSVSWGGSFGDIGEFGIHLVMPGDDDDAETLDVDESAMTLGLDWRKDCGFWIFDNSVIHADDLMDDFSFDYTMWSAMDAGGADVAFGWGVGYDGGSSVDGWTAVTGEPNTSVWVEDGTTGLGTCDGAGSFAESACDNSVEEVIGVTTADVVTFKQTATIGVEANMTDWATLRAGYNWTYDLACDFGDTDGVANDSCGGSTSELAFGLGFNWGGLTADLGINSGIFQDPVSTLTGQDDGADLTNGTLTLTYSF